MSEQLFNVIVLIGRPASGKSEIIAYLRSLPPDTRREQFHIGDLEFIDDFPMLWAWFEEDDILERFGKPRLHTDAEGYFKYPYLWHLLIERIGLEYQKLLRDRPALHEETTVIVEFSRGSEHGGYAEAFPHLPDDLLQRAGIVYVDVPFSESLRKNRRRFNPDRPDSILEHGLSDEKLTRLYRQDDWSAFSAADPQAVTVRSTRIPYAVFENADDVTTGTPDRLAGRLQAILDDLWRRRPVLG